MKCMVHKHTPIGSPKIGLNDQSCSNSNDISTEEMPTFTEHREDSKKRYTQVERALNYQLPREATVKHPKTGACGNQQCELASMAFKIQIWNSVAILWW